MIGAASLGSAAIGALVAIAVAVPAAGSGASGAGKTIFKKIRPGATWSKGTDLTFGPNIPAEAKDVSVGVQTARIAVVARAVAIEVTEAVEVKVASAKAQARSPGGYRIRIPENPNEKELLAVLQRLGLVASDSFFEVDKAQH